MMIMEGFYLSSGQVEELKFKGLANSVLNEDENSS